VLVVLQQMMGTLPGVIWPAASAPSIMDLPMRSLTLEHGSMLSSLAATRAPAPLPSLLRYTMGVLPASRGCRTVGRHPSIKRLDTDALLAAADQYRLCVCVMTCFAWETMICYHSDDVGMLPHR
jgi:hypothetical protein